MDIERLSVIYYLGTLNNFSVAWLVESRKFSEDRVCTCMTGWLDRRLSKKKL